MIKYKINNINCNVNEKDLDLTLEILHINNFIEEKEIKLGQNKYKIPFENEKNNPPFYIKEKIELNPFYTKLINEIDKEKIKDKILQNVFTIETIKNTNSNILKTIINTEKTLENKIIIKHGITKTLPIYKYTYLNVNKYKLSENIRNFIKDKLIVKKVNIYLNDLFNLPSIYYKTDKKMLATLDNKKVNLYNFPGIILDIKNYDLNNKENKWRIDQPEYWKNYKILGIVDKVIKEKDIVNNPNLVTDTTNKELFYNLKTNIIDILNKEIEIYNKEKKIKEIEIGM